MEADVERMMTPNRVDRSACNGVLFTVACCMLIASLPAGSAWADTTIETISTWNGGSTIAPVGEGTFETWGQTFTVPATDTVLSSFTMFVNDQIPFRPDFVEFAMYIMDWNVDRATGAILYQSPMVATSNQQSLEQFVFNTGGVPLTPGEDYIAIFSQSDFVDGSQGQGMVGSQFDMDAYPGHSFFRLATTVISLRSQPLRGIIRSATA